jgi:hypothetical protein
MKFIFLVLIIFVSLPARADDCNRDCNSDCCNEVDTGLFGKKTICEPACKTTCEANKKVCLGTGISLPNAPNVVNEVSKALQRSCASGFEVVTKYVILSQGFYPAGSDYMLNAAKTALVQAQLVSADEFNGVTIRWCSLKDANGMAPDRDFVCMSDALFNQAAHLQTAITLAHEMQHVRQYRQLGTDNFSANILSNMLIVVVARTTATLWSMKPTTSRRMSRHHVSFSFSTPPLRQIRVIFA